MVKGLLCLYKVRLFLVFLLLCLMKMWLFVNFKWEYFLDMGWVLGYVVRLVIEGK